MKLYELCDAEKTRFSPYCWRTRLALAIKGLEAEAVPVGFLEIPPICGGIGKSVPTLEADGDVVVDSFDIAVYLDDKHGGKPLFRGEAAKAHCRMIEGWANTALLGSIAQMIIVDVWSALADEDKTYFRESREKRFGKTLEEFQAGREDKVGPFNKMTLAPVRYALVNAQWLGGDEPDYADCMVFGTLMWAAAISDFEILEDGPVKDWFHRCMALMPDEPEVKAALAA